MAGLRLLTAATTLIALALPVEAQSLPRPPSGRSALLGISFRATGGDQWCAGTVDVELGAKTAKPAATKSASFQQMVGRIRGVVTTDCPAARNVTFRFEARNGSSALGEVSALTGWVYVPLELDGEREQCKGPEDPELCSQRWQAYEFMRSLSGGDRPIRELKLTRYLDAGPGSDVEFVRGGATGRLVILDEQEDEGRRELIRQQASIQAERCATSLVAVPMDGGLAGTTAEHMLCLADGKSKHAFLAAVPLQSGTAFFAVADYSYDGTDGSDLMTALLSNSEAAGIE